MEFTQKQKEAINTNANKVLVAAAAGSGKTSVMAKRIARLVKDGNDIENMLVMTFTRAATLQMKQKIAKELYETALQTQDKRLYFQSELVASGDICTFHSFCAGIIKQNYEICGVLPNFKILEESKADILRAKVVREMFDILYENKNEGFLQLLKRYSVRSNDATLAIQIFRIYSYVMSKPNGFLWLHQTMEKQKTTYITQLKIQYYNNLRELLVEGLDFFLAAYEIELEEDEKQGAKEKENIDAIKSMIEYAMKNGFDEFKKVFPKLEISRFTMVECPAKEIVRKFRDKGKECIKKVLDDENIEDFENIASIEYDHTKKDVNSICDIIHMFYNMYKKQKSLENALDYEDLQHLALIALKENKEFYSKKYKYIFIDEYQDTNPVQEEIINTINIDNNLFMVGDIKQSIYKFRLADPTIFRGKVANFKGKTLINMNENFRSKSEIIKCVNNVMNAVMSEKVGEVVYDSSEHLIENFSGGEAKLILCTKNEENKYVSQAKAIAKSIKEIAGAALDQRGESVNLTYDDIAIIVRSRSDIISAIKSVFLKEEIPCVIDDTQEQMAIELFVNILKVTDNCKNDIALLSVMRSVFFEFDENDFAKIKIYGKDEEFYNCAKYYEQNIYDDLAKKIGDFFEFVADLKSFCSAHTLDEFVLYAITKLDFEVYLATLTNNPKVAFDTFISTAMDLGEGKDLYTLIAALRDIKKRKGRYCDQKAQDASGVKVLTVHGAKGLEFSVVYLVNLEKKFNEKDLSADFIIDSDYGILPKYIDENNFIKKQTIEREVVKKRHLLEMKSEELRVLYVAMTRAMEKLFLVGYSQNIEEDMEKWNVLKPHNAQNLLDFIMCSKSIKHELFLSLPEEQEVGEKNIEEITDIEEKITFLSIGKAPNAPAKLSVTAIKKAQSKKKFYAPSLYEEEEISGARLGTLIHSIMEKEGEDAYTNALSMLENKLITNEEFESVVKHSEIINGFYKTPLFERIKNAKKVVREQNFYIKLNASEIGYDSKEEVIVQGIIDLAFLEDEWVIVDYKTDRVNDETVNKTAKSYKPQLDLYAYALDKITSTPVKECYLYFMRIKKSILLV